MEDFEKKWRGDFGSTWKNIHPWAPGPDLKNNLNIDSRELTVYGPGKDLDNKIFTKSFKLVIIHPIRLALNSLCCLN